MPGWGTGSFENEDAQSLLGRLNSLGIDDLRPMLSRAADYDDYLEVPESSTAVAAAEVIAALVVVQKGGAASPAAPRQVMEWLSKNKVDAPPAYELSFRYYENGVTTDLKIDYGEFAIKGDLKDITFHDAGKCADAAP